MEIILLTLAIYSVLVLLFVPLDKIGQYQKKVRKWADDIKRKVQE